MLTEINKNGVIGKKKENEDDSSNNNGFVDDINF
jgi:hypothetical protein